MVRLDGTLIVLDHASVAVDILAVGHTVNDQVAIGMPRPGRPARVAAQPLARPQLVNRQK